YAIVTKNTAEAFIDKMPRTEKQLERYREEDADGRYMRELFRKRGSTSERNDRPSRYYPIYVKDSNIRVPQMQWDDNGRKWHILERPENEEIVVYPIDENGVERTWRWKNDYIKVKPSSFRIKNNDGKITIYYKFRPNEEGVLPLTL